MEQKRYKTTSEMLPDIKLDLDRDRLKEIVQESLRMIREYIESDYIYTDEQIMDQFNRIISTGKISVPFYLKIGCKKIPDMELRVDPRRRKVLAKSTFRKKVGQLNHLLRSLG